MIVFYYQHIRECIVAQRNLHLFFEKHQKDIESLIHPQRLQQQKKQATDILPTDTILMIKQIQNALNSFPFKQALATGQ